MVNLLRDRFVIFDTERLKSKIKYYKMQVKSLFINKVMDGASVGRESRKPAKSYYFLELNAFRIRLN